MRTTSEFLRLYVAVRNIPKRSSLLPCKRFASAQAWPPCRAKKHRDEDKNVAIPIGLRLLRQPSRPTWSHLGVLSGAVLEPSWGLVWGRLGTILGSSGAALGPSWAVLAHTTCETCHIFRALQIRQKADIVKNSLRDIPKTITNVALVAFSSRQQCCT